MLCAGGLAVEDLAVSAVPIAAMATISEFGIVRKHVSARR
jgi:hypothetical protein